MTIPNNVYPVNYWGLIGEVEYSQCGMKHLEIYTEAIQDELNQQYYCKQCHKELEKERKESEEEE